jgi:hypothetical protein
MQPPEHDDAVRRAVLPEVLFAGDLSLALDLSLDETEAAARSGRFGPFFFVQGRVAILRDDFLEFLTLRAASSDQARKEVLS